MNLAKKKGAREKLPRARNPRSAYRFFWRFPRFLDAFLRRAEALRFFLRFAFLALFNLLGFFVFLPFPVFRGFLFRAGLAFLRFGFTGSREGGGAGAS